MTCEELLADWDERFIASLRCSRDECKCLVQIWSEEIFGASWRGFRAIVDNQLSGFTPHLLWVEPS